MWSEMVGVYHSVYCVTFTVSIVPQNINKEEKYTSLVGYLL